MTKMLFLWHNPTLTIAPSFPSSSLVYNTGFFVSHLLPHECPSVLERSHCVPAAWWQSPTSLGNLLCHLHNGTFHIHLIFTLWCGCDHFLLQIMKWSLGFNDLPTAGIGSAGHNFHSIHSILSSLSLSPVLPFFLSPTLLVSQEGGISGPNFSLFTYFTI